MSVCQSAPLLTPQSPRNLFTAHSALPLFQFAYLSGGMGWFSLVMSGYRGNTFFEERAECIIGTRLFCLCIQSVLKTYVSGRLHYINGPIDIASLASHRTNILHHIPHLFIFCRFYNLKMFPLERLCSFLFACYCGLKLDYLFQIFVLYSLSASPLNKEQKWFIPLNTFLQYILHSFQTSVILNYFA